jgi:WD40 repeat protein
VIQRQWLFQQSTIAALAWRPKGAQLAAAGYGGVSLYSPLDKNAPPRTLVWKGSMLNLIWSPDAKVLAGGCQDNSVHFWYTHNYRDSMMSGFAGKPKGLSWHRKGRWLAVAADQDIIVWPFDGKGPEDRSPTVISFHTDFLSTVAFAPTSDWLLAGCRGGILSLWSRVGAERPVGMLKMPSAIEFANWSPGKISRGAAVSQCGKLVIWNTEQ